MNKTILSVVAVASLALSATAAFAHGHVITGSEAYATPATSQDAENGRDHLVGKSDNGIEAREFRAVQRDTHWLRGNDPY